jgi:1-acyl-sn-glycerol-3-phosphate acyltransferase
MLYRFVEITTFIICKLFFGLKLIRNNAFPPKDQSFILASNHLSHLDPPLLASLAPRKMGFVAKEELFSTKLTNFIFHALGAVPLSRNASDIKALRTSLNILKEKPMVIFPQGERTHNLDQYKAGVGFLCKKTKLPVVAARIYGSGDVLPRGAKWFKRGKITVIAARVTDIDENDSPEQITAKIMNKIKSL